MSTKEGALAEYLGRLRCESAQCHIYQPEIHGDAALLRHALRHAGVPVLELNGAPVDVAESWCTQALEISAEYLVPVFIFGGAGPKASFVTSGMGEEVADQAWLNARQVALTRAIESSALNLEVRRSREKSGWLQVGWLPEEKMAQGNGLMLAWSSPLPLRRIRDFSARCPDLLVSGPDVKSLALDVVAQGISAARWRFAVK